jgi:flagellar hook-associated protein 2
LAQSKLQSLFFRKYQNTGSQYETLSRIGFGYADGQVTFDQDKFAAAYAANPDDVIALLSDANNGFLPALQTLSSQLGVSGKGTLALKADALGKQYDMFQDRLDQMDKLLESKRERLTASFTAMEQALSVLQTQQSALTSLQSAVEAWTSSSSSS